MTIDVEMAGPVIEPVVRMARSLGLDVREPSVLSVGANVVVHLAPAPVVARVATLTADMRGGAVEYLRREREISAALHDRGVNVVPPTNLADPGPHVAGGRAFLLLTYTRLQPVDLDSAEHAKLVGRSLVELLAALDELPSTLGEADTVDAGTVDAGAGQPWEEIERLIEVVGPTIEPPASRRIAASIEELRSTEPEDRWQLVHGDAHRTNVAFGDRGVTWFDFEDANRRPPAWDLATLRRTWLPAGDEACRLLEVEPEDFSMRWHHELRDVYALLWNLLYAKRFPEARVATAGRLADWLTRPDVARTLRRSAR